VKEVLSQNNVKYAYEDISAGMRQLKDFLKIRDNNEGHRAMRELGKVGLPTLVVDDNIYILTDAEDTQKLVTELKLAEDK
jgi:glutaredoxin-related protein